MKHLRSTASAVFAGVLLLAVCHTRTYSQESGLAPGSGEEVVLVGAGDNSKCDRTL